MTEETAPRFSELGLPPEIMAGIAAAGFETCTPIQAAALPRALAGHDVAGQAQTGTGKTAAFLIAVFNYLLTHPRDYSGKQCAPRALIMAPTRELAVQIHKDALVLGSGTDFRMTVTYGGADYDKQRNEIAAGTDILIGTPGRLIDYLKQGIYTLKHAQAVVLDEADRMFDLGFIRDIRYLLRRLPAPEERLNLLFSATLSQRVLELAYEHMNDPELVQIEPDKLTVDRVTQIVYFPSNEDKPRLLVHLLRSMHATRTMVFVNMKRDADYVARLLQANGFEAEAISGDVPQRKRLRMLRDFVSGELPVLVATDVASRGLHVPDVSHVINYDLPQDVEDYVHRIGRTARAGATGDSISFACETYAFTLPDIEEYIGHRIPVGSYDPDELPQLQRPAPRPPRAGGRRGGERRGQRGDGRGRRPAKRAQADEAAPAPKSGREQAGSETGAPKRRRRRRRRKTTAKGGPGD
ncbi:MAG: DEAD/DEAH box helicase [Gammaproteobacteria bacterium]|nr:MAG: DEAD/DEAH box helicase [Gammaproteobacteria bacterium]